MNIIFFNNYIVIVTVLLAVLILSNLWFIFKKEIYQGFYFGAIIGFNNFRLIFFKIYFVSLSITVFLYFYTLWILSIIDSQGDPYQIVFISQFKTFTFFFGLDQFALLFTMLVMLLIPICIFLNTFFTIEFFMFKIIRYSFKNYNLYHGNIICINLLLILQLILFYFFSTLDYFTFYIFFELSMVPLFFILGLFGTRSNKIKATYYLFFYTFIGGLFFLFGLVLMYSLFGTFDLYVIMNIQDNLIFSYQKLIWLCIFIPIGIKIPIVPLHIWLPEAHVEASTEGSVLLAGLLLKLGGYGFLRFLLPVFIKSTLYFISFLSAICVLGVIYISMVIFITSDMKKIVAYSSIIHMNFAFLGLLSGNINGIHGGIFLMFVHGIVSSGLFIVIGLLYKRYHTRLLQYYQGLVIIHPTLGFFFFIFLLANFAFPGTCGFIGELLVILGLFSENYLLGLILMYGVFLSALYSLLLYTRLFSGILSFMPFYSNKNRALFLSITHLEFNLLVLFLLFILFLGLFPGYYLLLIEDFTFYLYLINK